MLPTCNFLFSLFEKKKEKKKCVNVFVSDIKYIMNPNLNSFNLINIIFNTTSGPQTIYLDVTIKPTIPDRACNF